jgi:hypothetical protein
LALTGATVDLGFPLRHAGAMTYRSQPKIPLDLRSRVEAARLDLLALFRALDQMDLSVPEIPQRLIRQLFELDADYVEALWALDRPRHKLDVHALLRDTLASLDQLCDVSAQFRKNLPRRAHPRLETLQTSIRENLDPREAYNMVPGRDPKSR